MKNSYVPELNIYRKQTSKFNNHRVSSAERVRSVSDDAKEGPIDVERLIVDAKMVISSPIEMLNSIVLYLCAPSVRQSL